MGAAGLIEQFDRRALACASASPLRRLVAETARELGFDYFALLHHLALKTDSPRLIRIDNYPEGWEAELRANGLVADDPVHLASGRTNVGFAWEALPALMPLSRRHRDILERSGRFGIGEGFTVPAHVPGEPGGSCSFAVRRGRALPKRSLLCAEQIGAHAFGAARRLLGYPLTGARPRLSRREIECLHLVAAGKSDWAIARILGISEETARQYVKRARAAYGVASRAQLVVHGLRDGWIGFDDVIGPVRREDW